MTNALLILLAMPVSGDVHTTGPRVITLREGQIVQVWPSQPVPEVIQPHREWPEARPFGPQPSAGRRTLTSFMSKLPSTNSAMTDRSADKVRSNRPKRRAGDNTGNLTLSLHSSPARVLR